MKKNALKETKRGLKGSKGNKPTHGGARPGAGRKPKGGKFQQMSIDMPAPIIEAMEAIGVKNKTAYIVWLAARDLKGFAQVRGNAKLRAKLEVLLNETIHVFLDNEKKKKPAKG